MREEGRQACRNCAKIEQLKLNVKTPTNDKCNDNQIYKECYDWSSSMLCLYLNSKNIRRLRFNYQILKRILMFKGQFSLIFKDQN